jgi:hypothetical protein
MATTVNGRGRAGRGALVVGAAIAGAAFAALAPGGATPVWTGLGIGILAAVNGYGTTATP